MAITYKTVIAQAIQHFNDVQTALHDVGAKYNGQLIDAFSTTATLLPTGALDTVIREQLQLKAVGNIELTQASATDVTFYATATVKAGSAVPKIALTNTSSAASGATTITSRYFKITPKATVNEEGWISSITDGSDVNYTVKAGSATTPTASAAASSVSLNGTTLTVSRSVTPTVSAGWVASGTAGTVTTTATVPTEEKTASASGNITPSSGKLLSKVSVPAGALADATVSGATVTVKVGTSGWLAEGTSKSATIANASVTATPAVTHTTYDGTNTTALEEDILVDDAPTSGGYYKVSMDPSVTVNVASAGYVASNAGIAQDGTTVDKYIKKGSVTQPTATQSGASATLSGTTVTLSKSVTPTVSTAGYVTSGTAGTVKLSGTVPTETKTASAAGDVTPTSGKLLTKVTVPSATVGSASINGDTVSFAISKAGWVGTQTLSAAIPAGNISTGTEDKSTKTDASKHTAVEKVVPSGGYLYIGAGYYPNTQISLDSIIGGLDDSSITAALSNVAYLREGYVAYTLEGTEIVGTMADWDGNTTYYTQTNTGFGLVPGGRFTTADQYIKAATGFSSSASVTAAPTVTVSKNIASSITTSTTDTYGTGFSIKATTSETNGSVSSSYSISTPGWTTTKSNVAGGTATIDPTVTNNFSAAEYITKLTIPAGKSFGSASADGITISGSSGSIGKLYVGFGSTSTASNYGELYLRNTGTSTYKKVGNAGKLITGTAKAPTSITGSSASVTVTNGTVKLTKTVSVTPTVTEGWIASGTATNSAIELSGTIATTSLTGEDTKGCTITGNTTSPTTSGGNAVINTDANSPYSVYVKVNATSRGTASVGTGYIGTNSISFAASDSATIAALLEPVITANGTASATVAVGSATTFSGTTGEIVEEGQKTKLDSTAISGAVSGDVSTFKDKYIIGDASVSGSVSGSVTANIDAEATGENVDHYVEQMYKRILGLSYEQVSADAA